MRVMPRPLSWLVSLQKPRYQILLLQISDI